MDQKEIADGFKQEPSALEKAADWIRRHLFARKGEHGNTAVEAGVKFEF